MRTFKVFDHPNASAEAVKVGFSWPCLFFGIFWTLAKRLWLVAGIVGGLTVLSVLIEELLIDSMSYQDAASVSMVFNLLFWVGWLVFSAKANEVREGNLQARGFQLIGNIEADSPDAAIAELLAPKEAGSVQSANLSA